MWAPLQPARACTPLPGAPPTIEERFEAATVVFSGRVVATGGRVIATTGALRSQVIQEPGILGLRYPRFFNADFVTAALPYYAVVEVEQYLKGWGSGEVAVMGFGYGTDCLNSAEAGDTLLFFATGSTPLYALRYLYPHMGVAPWDRRSQAALAETIAPQPMPPDTTRYYPWLPVGGLGLGMVAAGLRGLGWLIRQ
jgi:hypothetical protein